jgi:hypothetical protein
MLVKVPQRILFRHPGDENIVEIGEVLSREEEVARQKELTENAIARRRAPNHSDFLDAEARLGIPLEGPQIVERLRRLLPTLHVRDGAPGCLAYYLPAPNGESLQYLGWTYRRTSPEYSSYIVNSRNIAVQERRGWRTFLLRLVLAGVITEKQALRVFGPPSNGIVGKYWAKALWEKRNHKRPTAQANQQENR